MKPGEPLPAVSACGGTVPAGRAASAVVGMGWYPGGWVWWCMGNGRVGYLWGHGMGVPLYRDTGLN